MARLYSKFIGKRGEGAIFAWLWLKDLPINDWQLYQELKEVGVIVVPGSTFFPGLREDWQHKHECVRISLTATESEIIKAMKLLAQVVEKVYLTVNTSQLPVNSY